MVRKKTLRLLLCDYQRAAVTILYIGLSNAGCLTTLRLFYDYFIGETTTIGYDYSSRNAATIADLYWLSGESPKKSCGESRQWFRAARCTPAAGLPRRVEDARLTRCQTASRRADPVQVETLTHQQVRRAGMVCAMLHPYIHYYNRAAALPCPASGVAVVSIIGAGRPGAVIRSNVAQPVQYRQMHPPHDGGKTRQIAGKAPVRLYALFCSMCNITALTAQNAL